ncbi:MAG: hypothetical protein WAO58_01025 [Fimbriimonadaceae bacterium]
MDQSSIGMRAVVLAALCLVAQWCRSAELIVLPRVGVDPRAGAVSPVAVSDDGNVVVGSCEPARGERQAFIWRRGIGMEIFSVPGGSSATAISADGKVIVGEAMFSHNEPPHAFRWEDSTGIEDLGTLGGDGHARAISADGSIISGDGTNIQGHRRVFRWTRQLGMEDLGGMGQSSNMTSMSADGRVIAGYNSAGNIFLPWWRTDSMGFRHLPSDFKTAFAYTVSGDGSRIFGRCPVNGEARSGYWENGGEFQPLPGLGTTPSDVSDDGNTIVGSVRAAPARAVRWKLPGGELEVLDEVYRHLLPNGGRLQNARGVSADGRFIVGSLTKPRFSSRVSETYGYILDTSD